MSLSEDLESIQSETGLAGIDIDALLRDEHARYAFYLKVIALAPPPDDRKLLSVILDDPDKAMGEAAAVELVGNKAHRKLSYQSFSRWADSVSDIVRDHEFLSRRIREWSDFKRIMETGTIDSTLLSNSSDWLQRKLSETTDSIQVLEKLAEKASTKRIRNSAKQRLKNIQA
jgi:hypothetical protein